MSIVIFIGIACVLFLCVIYYWEYRIRCGDREWGYRTNRYGDGFTYHMRWPFSFKRQPKPPQQREERMWV